MPCLTERDIVQAMDAVLGLMPCLERAFQPPFRAWQIPPEPGAVPYRHLNDAFRQAHPDMERAHAFHLVRAACNRLAGQARLELFLKTRTHNGCRRDRVQWVRLPGRRGQVYHLPSVPEHQPRRKRKAPETALEASPAPETTAPIEAELLRLLSLPIADRDLLACSSGVLPPGGLGSGWMPLLYLTTRLRANLTHTTVPTRYSLLSVSIRRLHERRMVELMGRRFTRKGSSRPCFRVKWIRLRHGGGCPDTEPGCYPAVPPMLEKQMLAVSV